VLPLLSLALAQDCDPVGVDIAWIHPADGATDVVVDAAVAVGFRGPGGDLAEWDVAVEVDGVPVESAVATDCWVDLDPEPVACLFVVDPVAELPADTEVEVVGTRAGTEVWVAAFRTGSLRAPAPTGTPAVRFAAGGVVPTACAGDFRTADVSVEVQGPTYVLLRDGIGLGHVVGALHPSGATTVLVSPLGVGCVTVDPVWPDGTHGESLSYCPPGALNEGCDTGILCVIGNCCQGGGAVSFVLLLGLGGGWSRLARAARRRPR